MSPQFVDFNGDGHLDIVAGIFDGSPHVAFGDGKHWRQPQGILDKDGQRIVLNAFWNFDTKKWDETDRCDPEGGAPAEGHLTSAWAFDQDGDGDLDLLLGDHRSGYVYLRRNEGSNAQPAFATRNELVKVDGKPILVPGTVTTLRTIDWTGDGKPDLLVGSMGDAYGPGTGGGVFIYPNAQKGNDQRFGAAVTLIAASPKGATELTRPDAGLYMDAVDHDGDGDLDLIVGAYSTWEPKMPPLTDAQQAKLAELQVEQQRVTEKFQAFNERMVAAQEGLDSDAAKQKRVELMATEEYQTLSKQRSEVGKQITELSPGPRRDSFVWLYDNLGKGKTVGKK